MRVAQFVDGAELHCADSAAWDAFALACGPRDTLVVRAQQSWRAVLVSLLATALLLAALFRWGVPWAAQAAIAIVPHEVDAAVGERVLASLDQRLMQPSALPAPRRQALRESFARLLAAQSPGSLPAHRIEFRASAIGANALALPGGTLIVTDAMVALFETDAQVIDGVLAHELGHLQHRHGMRSLLQAAALGVLASLVIGDASGLLAGAPVLLGHAAYSREAEREADAECARLLAGAGVSPTLMLRFFDGIEAQDATRHAPAWLGISIASHPADAERRRFFAAAAAAKPR